MVFWITQKTGDQVYKAVLDTGDTLSIVACRLLKEAKIWKTKTVAIRVGDGKTIHSLGGVHVTVCLGDEQVTQQCKVLDTDAFDNVIGTYFLRRNPELELFSLQHPNALHCDFGSGLFSVPLELTGRRESGLCYVNCSYRTENYQLVWPVLENGPAALQVDLNEVQEELFASKEQHMMQLYFSPYLNNTYRFFWRSMELCYANLPFSQLAKVLTKITLEGARVIMCTSDWGTTGGNTYWRRLLDGMMMGRTELPNRPMYISEDSQETMPAPGWGSFLSIVDGSLNPVPASDLDQVVLKELTAENRGLTLPDIKKRSKYSSVTTTSGECSDEPETRAVPTPLADADDRLARSPVLYPRLTRRCLHSSTALSYRSCLWMKWISVSPLMAGLMTTPFSPCKQQMALQVKYLAPNPHPTTCLILGTTYRIFSRFYGLRLRVSSDRPAWTSSRGPGKRL